MKAAFYRRFGPPEVLEVGERPAPAPRPGASRVRVSAAALNPKDVLLRKGKLRWLVRAPLPRIPGYDLAGELMDPAPGLERGTRVYGMIQDHAGGACAEVASLPHDQLAAMPAGLSPQEASALPLAGLTALQALRGELELSPGQHVLINGASGGVGTLAVQIAKAMGAEVTAVCSGRNAELVTRLGADRVLDYTVDDVGAERGLHHVFDVFGSLPWARAKPMLRSGGRFCTAIPRPGALVRGALHRLHLHRAALVVVQSRRRDLDQLTRWVEDGELRPVIDREVSLNDTHEGHAYLETRRARGKVVVVLG